MDPETMDFLDATPEASPVTMDPAIMRFFDDPPEVTPETIDPAIMQFVDDPPEVQVSNLLRFLTFCHEIDTGQVKSGLASIMCVWSNASDKLLAEKFRARFKVEENSHGVGLYLCSDITGLRVHEIDYEEGCHLLSNFEEVEAKNRHLYLDMSDSNTQKIYDVISKGEDIPDVSIFPKLTALACESFSFSSLDHGMFKEEIVTDSKNMLVRMYSSDVREKFRRLELADLERELRLYYCHFPLTTEETSQRVKSSVKGLFGSMLFDKLLKLELNEAEDRGIEASLASRPPSLVNFKTEVEEIIRKLADKVINGTSTSPSEESKQEVALVHIPPHDPLAKPQSEMNASCYFNDVLGTYILSRLFEKKDVRDWKFGMDKKEEFVRFDDIVIGLHKKDDEFSYYTFQLEGYADDSGSRENAFSSSDILHVPAKEENKKDQHMDGDGVNLWHFFNAYLKMPQYFRRQTNCFILYSQHTMNVLTQHSEYFEDLPNEALKEITDLLPPADGGKLRKISAIGTQKLITEYKEQDNPRNVPCEGLLGDFLSKFLIMSNQPVTERTNQLGEENLKEGWKVLRSSFAEQNYYATKSWVRKIELLEQRVTFQGEEHAVKVCDLIEDPGEEVLLQLYADREKLLIGNSIKGLGEIKRHFIGRQFVEGKMFKEKVIVIEGEPGMGKSTLLSHAAIELKKDEKSKIWIIELNASSLTQVFSNPKGSESALEILQRAAFPEFKGNRPSIDTINHRLSLQCFKRVIGDSTQKECILKIGIFIDDVDEIKIEHKDDVLAWISKISSLLENDKSGLKTMWISTRSYLKDEIAKCVGRRKSYTIALFSKKDRDEFLRKYWQISGEDIGIVAEKLDSTLSRDLDTVLRNPITTMMFAYIYKDDHKALFSEDLQEKLNMVWLFDTFVQNTLENEYAKNFRMKGSKRSRSHAFASNEQNTFFHQHGVTSLCHLYPHIDVEKILPPSERRQKDALVERLSSTGEMTARFIKIASDGELQFRHRMFAEYFAAKWLFGTLMRLKEEEETFGERPPQLKKMIPFLQAHHMKPENAQVKLFLSWMSTKGNGTHTKLIKELLQLPSKEHELAETYIKELECHLDEKDLLGRLPFHLALENDLLPHAFLLLGKNRNCSAVNAWDYILANNWLLMACQKAEIELARSALQCGADVNYAAWHNKRTGLHLSSEIDDASTALMLLEHDADINRQDSKGNSPLHLALDRRGMSKVAQLFLESDEWRRNINVTTVNEELKTTLHIACYKKHCRSGEILLAMGADINATDSSGRTPMYYAIRNRLLETVNTMLEDEDSPMVRNALRWRSKNDATLFHVACEDGNVKIAKLILKKTGTDINATDEQHMTPLHYACRRGNVEIVKMLLGKSDEIGLLIMTAVDDRGRTPLHHAIARNPELIKAVIENIGSTPELQEKKSEIVNAKDNDGNTPLHDSCRNGHSETAELLLDAGADINASNERGCSPLYNACGRFSNIETLKLLFRRGAHINAAGEGGKLPLHYACEQEQYEIVRYLLSVGASISATDDRGRTALHYAFAWDQNSFNAHLEYISSTAEMKKKMLKALTDHIDSTAELQKRKLEIINARDNDGNTPLHEAFESYTYIRAESESGRMRTADAIARGPAELVQLLLEHGGDPDIENIKGARPFRGGTFEYPNWWMNV